MVDAAIVRRKLQRLARYLEELDELSGITLEEYLRDFRHRRAVERVIQLMVDAAVDINTHILVDAGKPAPGSAFSSFLEAAGISLFPEDFAQRIAPSTGERNILVHEYEKIDDIVIYESIPDARRLYRQYLRWIHDFISRARETKQ